MLDIEKGQFSVNHGRVAIDFVGFLAYRRGLLPVSITNNTCLLLLPQRVSD